MLCDDQHHFLFPSSFHLPPLSSSSLPSSSSLSVVIVESPVLWSLPPLPFPIPLPTGLFDHRYTVIVLVRTSGLRSSSVFPLQISKPAIQCQRSSEASTRCRSHALSYHCRIICSMELRRTCYYETREQRSYVFLSRVRTFLGLSWACFGGLWGALWGFQLLCCLFFLPTLSCLVSCNCSWRS